jgi:catechol 2,3-dioxygenase-like lactoylglutathione lyase family enzyme
MRANARFLKTPTQATKEITMPSMKKVHHVGIPVSNLERSLAWYQDVLEIVAANVTGAGSGEVLSQMLEVPDADVRAAFVKVGDHMQFELLQYHAPTPEPYTLRNCDIGAVHICFEVDDIHAAHDELKAKGVHINSPPVPLDGTGGDLDGHWFCYFRDPDGVQLELMELPKANGSAA